MPRRQSNIHTTDADPIDARAQAVLAALIKDTSGTGEAVSSRALADRFGGSSGWSSATIRNVLAELEEAGLVEQPHTSAGSTPTDKGYRYYVDNTLEESRLSRADLRAIDKVLRQPDSIRRPHPNVLWRKCPTRFPNCLRMSE